jgi:hypothetical protein
MASDNASSVQGLALRLTPLTDEGLVAGNTHYVTRQFISLSFTPEYEDADEITEKNADGSLCVQYKGNDSFKHVTVSLSICAPEPEMYHTLAGGTLLGPTGQAAEHLGWAAPEVGSTPAPPVCIEVWSRAVVGGKMASVNPYWHWVFPQASLKLSGDRTLENGLLANGFEGLAVGNAGLQTALSAYDQAPWEYTTKSPMQYARVAEIPTTFGSVTPTP